mmetsp:Transcript_54511/g.90368  ORF Transcript_54511/g.90368 Transcript_54511/m.90368 type:complete len:920 (-) Transcript_54511:311-3070(-)
MEMNYFEDEIPKPWQKSLDKNGQSYYINTETGQIRRQPPITAGGSTYQKTSQFLDPEQWDLVIETMASTIHPQQQLRIFQKLKKIAEKMITKNDAKYRTLYLNNPKLQHTVLAFDGGLEFLYNLGFEPHPESRDKLVCQEVNQRVVQACLICLEDKIDMLSYDVAATRRPSVSEADLPHLPNDGASQPMPAQAKSWSQLQSAPQQYHHQQQHQQQQQQQWMNSMNPLMQQQQQQHPHHPQQPHSNALDSSYHSYHSHNGASSSFEPPPPLHGNNKNNAVMSNLNQLGFHSHNPNQNQNQNMVPSASYTGNVNHQALRPMQPPPMKQSASASQALSPRLRAQGQQPQQQHQQQEENEPRPLHLSVASSAKLNDILGSIPPKHTRMYKTFLFIRHGNSIWNRFKASGRKKKFAALAVGIIEYARSKQNPQNHADTWVVDAPLSRIGIDEAYGLSRFLGRHLTVRQFESLADLEHHQLLATPIKDALRIVQSNILDSYAMQLQQVSPQLHQECVALRNILTAANERIHRIMLNAQERRNGGNAVGAGNMNGGGGGGVGGGGAGGNANGGGDGGGKKAGHGMTKGGGYGGGYIDDNVKNGGNDASPDLVDDPMAMMMNGGGGDGSDYQRSSNKSLHSSNQNQNNNNGHLSMMAQMEMDANGYLMDDDDEKQKRKNKQHMPRPSIPDLLRPFSHVVIANQVENVETSMTENLEVPLDLEWTLDQLIDSSSNSIVVTSNLRRAISTAVIALWDRFGANMEPIHILPCLQELGMNVDTHTPIMEAETPEVSNFEKTSKKLNVPKLTEFYRDRLKVEQSMGSFGKKSLRESGQDTLQRLNFFCDWAFKKENDNGQPFDTIIACGHSHWFRAFFKNFLPKGSSSMAPKQKLQNCAVVGFRMICTIGPEDQRTYEIIDRSITPIYRGFI